MESFSRSGVGEGAEEDVGEAVTGVSMRVLLVWWWKALCKHETLAQRWT